MEEKNREVEEIKDVILEKVDRMDVLLKQMAKFLAMNTNYATMISTPEYHHNKLKFIQLSRVDVLQVLAVIVVEGNIIKNRVIDLEEELTDDTLLKLNIMLNTGLNGMSPEEINLGMITRLKDQAGVHSAIVGSVIDAVADAIGGEEDLEIYTSGTNNIFKYPELSDNQRASELISAFEEKQQFVSLVHETLEKSGESDGIRVYIGNETPIQTMKDCSIVTATYELEEGMQGTIGIIGPKRMDYKKVVKTLRNLMVQLDSLYKKT